MVTGTKVKRPATEAQRAALARGRAAIAAKREREAYHDISDLLTFRKIGDAPQETVTPVADATEHGGYWMYLCDATRRKHPIWVPVETDPAKNTLILERTDYDKGWHGELLPHPNWPEAYWVADVHDDTQLRPAEQGGHVYDASHYVTERTR